jgi:hypothetical protein
MFGQQGYHWHQPGCMNVVSSLQVACLFVGLFFTFTDLCKPLHVGKGRTQMLVAGRCFTDAGAPYDVCFGWRIAPAVLIVCCTARVREHVSSDHS